MSLLLKLLRRRGGKHQHWMSMHYANSSPFRGRLLMRQSDGYNEKRGL